MLETSISWLEFFKIIGILIILYLVISFFKKVAPQIFNRKSIVDKITNIINRVLEIYKPIAVLIILLSFVSINYRVHGILFLLLIVVAFNYIKSYVNGVLFKINPLVALGSNISTGEFNGQISKFLHFGFILNETEGDRFINYSYIDKNGFSVSQHDENAMRKTLYIQDSEEITTILDLLFDNPLVDFSQKPTLKKLPVSNQLQLNLTLEKGAKIEALISYLEHYNFNASQIK
nr:hypothetical protein [uncultured Psychroserpens sp.]